MSWLGRPAIDITHEDPEGHGVGICREAWIGDRAYHYYHWGRPPAAELATVFDSFTPAK